MNVELTVNGRRVARELPANELLLDFLRERLGLTGAKRSCDVQVCGTCTVLVDGRPVSSCCFLAADADGRDVLTVEGLAERPEFDRLEQAFTRYAALQCGFCTPGFVLTAAALLEAGEATTAEEIKQELSGNLCRCTGYQSIVVAVCDLAGVAA
jgi:aerobic-type carbon monoxide dehydrogenase small subunit (CoxS/CutS family)